MRASPPTTPPSFRELWWVRERGEGIGGGEVSTSTGIILEIILVS